MHGVMRFSPESRRIQLSLSGDTALQRNRRPVPLQRGIPDRTFIQLLRTQSEVTATAQRHRPPFLEPHSSSTLAWQPQIRHFTDQRRILVAPLVHRAGTGSRGDGEVTDPRDPELRLARLFDPNTLVGLRPRDSTGYR